MAGQTNYWRIVIHFSSDAITFDFFCSGTTVQRSQSQSTIRRDRKFILIEMEDYANDITVERVNASYGWLEKTKYGYWNWWCLWFLRVRCPLFLGNQHFNEVVELEKLREYIWCSETCTFNPPRQKRLIGKNEEVVYYFMYRKMDKPWITKLCSSANQREQHQYADHCILPKELRTKYKIIFKNSRNFKQF